MTEVGGEAAVYFDPAAPAAAAAIIAQSLERPGSLREAGPRHATRWNSEVMLDAYADLYSRLRSRRDTTMTVVA
jgi:hypothetical protein